MEYGYARVSTDAATMIDVSRATVYRCLAAGGGLKIGRPLKFDRLRHENG